LSVTALAFTPDGKTLAAGSVDGTIALWDVTQYKEPKTPGDGRR
jgi:WD40 repeat protein